jgi:DNA-binding beta-propeller fold protein YncE
MPMGIVYNPNNSMVYVALYQTSQLAEIDKILHNYTLYNIIGGAWGVTVDIDGDVWIVGKLSSKIAMFSISDKTIQYFNLPFLGQTILYFNNYIWVAGGNTTELGVMNGTLAKIDLNGNIVATYIISTPEFCSQYGSYIEYLPMHMKGYASEIWISLLNHPNGFVGFEGKIAKFDISTENITVVSGFDRPLSIEVDENYVYIAENHWLTMEEIDLGIEVIGKIAVINKTSMEVTRINTTIITNEGPYYVLKDSYGYLWFTDNSNHLGIVGGVIYNSTSPYCYFMTEVPGNSIWFSCVGSAYIGVKETGTLGRADINKDGKVDILDVTLVTRIYGAKEGELNYNSNSDVNRDGKIDILDVVCVTVKYGSTL